MAICSYCSLSYSGSKTNHTRSCTKSTFFVHLHPLSKRGVQIPIQRDKDDKIICQCVDSQGNVCQRRVPSQSALFKHLKKVNHDLWQVISTLASPFKNKTLNIQIQMPSNTGPALAPIPEAEDLSRPQSPSVCYVTSLILTPLLMWFCLIQSATSSPAAPNTPNVSPKAMSIVASPSRSSTASQMSVDSTPSLAVHSGPPSEVCVVCLIILLI